MWLVHKNQGGLKKRLRVGGEGEWKVMWEGKVNLNLSQGVRIRDQRSGQK